MTPRLRALEPSDIDAIYKWENDPSLWDCSASHQPFSADALRKFIDENSLCDIYASRQLRLMADRNGTPVGCIDLYDFDPRHHRAGVGILVDAAWRRQGIALAMLEDLEDFASRHLRLHQLHCTVSSSNTPSLALFAKAGFSHCGTMREWTLENDGWTDAMILQKILQ